MNDVPVMAKSGRSFDFGGFRIRAEARHGDDRVEPLMASIVEALRRRRLEGVEWCVEHDRPAYEDEDCCPAFIHSPASGECVFLPLFIPPVEVS